MNRTRTCVMSLMAVLGGAAAIAPVAAQANLSTTALYSAAQAKRGEALYAEHCAPCHGTDLAGTEFGPGLAAADLQARWKGRAVGDLFALMRSSMPLTSPGGLSAPQNADILAFVLQRAAQPAGASDLPSDPVALSKIPFPSR